MNKSSLLLCCALLAATPSTIVRAETGREKALPPATTRVEYSNPGSEDAELHSSRVLVYKAIYDSEFKERAARALDSLARNERYPAHVQMYSAILKAAEARDGFWPARRIRLINEALGEMETVLTLAPHDYEFRLLRASVWLDLPDTFKKKEAATSELTTLASNFETGSRLYANYLRSQWLEFFLDHDLYRDKDAGRKLARSMLAPELKVD
jgi:hypothetical protein